MLVKTNQFDNQLRQDIHMLTLNPQKVLKIKGSYSRKEIGSYITDIDITALVWFGHELLRGISNVLVNIKRENKFTFIQMGCGRYKEFIIPWNIDDEGSCTYNHNTARDWYVSLKDIVSEDIYNKGEKILFNSDISINDLIEVENILLPFAEIDWSETAIGQGYVDVRGIRYYLLREMQTETPVLEFVYNPWGNEVCGVDIGMVDKRFDKGASHVMYKYYTQNWYGILKSLRWKLKDEFMSEFMFVLKELELLVATKYKLELIQNIKDKNLYSAKKIGSISKELYVIENIQEKIDSICKKHVLYFQRRVNDKYISDVTLYFERGLSGAKRINIHNTTMSCPFFSTKINDFKEIHKLARRFLMSTDRLADCFVDVGEKQNKSIGDIMKEVMNNKLLLDYVGDDIALINDGIEVGRYPLKDMKHLQMLVLVYN
jgi:hypothetical protein